MRRRQSRHTKGVVYVLIGSGIFGLVAIAGAFDAPFGVRFVVTAFAAGVGGALIRFARRRLSAETPPLDVAWSSGERTR